MAQDTPQNIPAVQSPPAGYSAVAMPGAQMPEGPHYNASNQHADTSVTQMVPGREQQPTQPLGGSAGPFPGQPTGFYAVPGQQSQESSPQHAATVPPTQGVQPLMPIGSGPLGQSAPLGGGPPLPVQPYSQGMMPGHPPPPNAVAPAPQSFAIPGSNQENAQAPPPFQPPLPLPVVHQYQWQPGVHHIVGAPVQIQQVYYPPPPQGKGQDPQNFYVPEGVQFEQGKIDLDEQVGIKVANKGCHCLDCWALEFVFFLLVLFTIPLVIITPALIAVPVAIYLIRFIVLCCTDTSKFLSKLNLDINPYDLTATLQKTDPYTTWNIRCYHYETRTRVVTESDGQGGTRTRTETYTVRVDTHHNSKCIRYPDCVDGSPILSGLEKYRMTRIYNTLKIAFATQELNEKYYKKRTKWIRKNDLDTHYDFTERDHLPGLISHLLTFNDDRSKYPACLTCCSLVCLGFLMMDWILIFWFMRHSARLDYQYFKIAQKIDT